MTAGHTDTMAPPANTTPSRLEQSAFGTGGLAGALFTTVPGLVLLYYLTDTLGVAAGLAGLVVALPRLADLVINPLVGRLSDRTHTRWGSRRPWMAAGGVSLPIAFVLLFWSPWQGDAAALWVACTFAVGGMCFALFAVPWSALPAEIGQSDRGRTTMMSWRVMFQGVGILLAGGLAPVLVELGGGGTTGYRVMAVAMAAVMVCAMAIAIFVGARRSIRTAAARADSGSLRDGWRLIRATPALRHTLLVIVFCEVAAATALASAPYIADHVIGSPEATPVVFVAVIAPMLVMMPLWSRIAVRRSKKLALRCASAAFAVGAAALVMVPFLATDLRLAAAVGAVIILGAGMAGTSMLPPAMLADAIADDAAHSGKHRAGLITGAANAVEVAAGSLGAGIYALLLSLFGFVSSRPDEAIAQTMTAQIGIVAAVAVVAALTFASINLILTRTHADTSTAIDGPKTNNHQPVHIS